MADITIDFEERDGTRPIRARLPRCCADPMPHIGMRRGGKGAAYTAEMYCRKCLATYGIMTWEK